MSMIKSRKHQRASQLLAVATVALPFATHAADDPTQLPTIEVQAEQSNLKVDQSANTKYVAPLLDTPKSVDIISQRLLTDTNSNTLATALQNVPGITFAAGEGGTPFTDMPYIRGYSSESSIYVDGVRNSTSQNRDMFAVEQVEVTKGSSSTISGGGGVGGSINLIPKTAHQGDQYQGTIANGTDDYAHIMLDANKDFGKGTAGRVVVMAHQNDKAGQTNGAEYKRIGIAPSVAFGLGTANRATLSYYFLKSNDEPDSGIPFNNASVPTGISGTAGNGEPVNVKQGTYYGWKNRDFDKRENHIGTIKLEHDFSDDLTIGNVATYTKSKSDYIYTNADDSKGNIYRDPQTISRRALSRIVDTQGFSDQLSLKGKFNTGTIKHSFNTGVEYSYQSTDQGVYTFTNTAGTTTSTVFSTVCNASDAANNGWCTSLNNPQNGAFTDTLGSIRNQYTTRSRNTGIYLLDNIEFTPQWILNLGARWDDFNTERKYNKDVVSRGTTTPAGTTISSDTDFFSYQAGLVFKPTKNGSIYFSYATSVNPVGIDQGDGSDSLSDAIKNLDPEKARTYELGTKWDILNNRANITAAIFRTEKQNTRVTNGDGTTANVGSSKVDGFELGINGNITDQWAISVGYNYLDGELTDNGYVNTGTSTNPIYTASPLNGNQLPFVTKQSATLWTTYDISPKLTLGAGAQYKDKVYANTANTKILPTYTIYNAMARYNVNDNINLQLNVNNISDKRYFTSAHAAHYAFEGEGRNAVFAVNFKY
ncbi:TonB-dependent siderophore receptor [Acinetobacter qingfengensis]|uniref:Ligand-gated channel protein n=1 Tax=Acinetobacter qingfengensis TaxID=1262585 RepID=A0A1E7R174_9GAMM|nr:TonB-dependent siderophore receptor [Acinetobacter qingfengensis]KAA8733324.1 TonB-dependent siderophore receptor [Acinetobacter qingfengensis]OEY93049.1 ligand-gated channel protein [Acinetobacter qingfengensis]